MTFGAIKSVIEENLIESYKNENDFKKSLREFKANILNNHSISKVYSIYEQIYTPQNLSEKDAEIFLNEGIHLIRILLKGVKLPITIKENINNSYESLDTLVYSNILDLNKRVEARKKLMNVLMSQKVTLGESIKLPIKTMVNIANQTLDNYIQNMDNDSKKVFMNVIKSDTESLKNEFTSLKESTISKLKNLLDNEKAIELKQKLDETIKSVNSDEFSQMNYVRLVFLEKNL